MSDQLYAPLSYYIELAERHARTCAACGRLYFLRCDCLSERIHAHVAHWDHMVKLEEHRAVPIEVALAYGTLENADTYRTFDCAIPRDELQQVYRALETIEQLTVSV